MQNIYALFTFLLFFCINIVIAQTNAIVVLKNQSIKNITLDNHAWIQDNSVKELDYNHRIPTASIDYILIGNDKYVPRHTQIYASLKPKMNSKPTDYTMQDSLMMLQVRVQGSVSLFTYKNIDGTIRYLVEKEGTTQEIIRVEFIKRTADLAYLEFYKTDLLRLLDDCPVSILQEIEKTAFKLSSLIKLINLYNVRCGQIDYVNTKENFKISTSLGVYGSLEYFSSRFASDFLIQEFQATPRQVGLAVKIKPQLSSENIEIILFGGQQINPIGFQLPSATRLNGVDTLIIDGQYAASAREFGVGFNYFLDKKLGKRQQVSPFVGFSLAHRHLLIKENILEITKITPNPFGAISTTSAPIVIDRINNISRFKAYAGFRISNFETSLQVGTSKGGLTNYDDEFNTTVSWNVGYFFNVR